MIMSSSTIDSYLLAVVTGNFVAKERFTKILRLPSAVATTVMDSILVN